MILKFIMEILISIIGTILNAIGTFDGTSAIGMVSNFLTFILQFVNQGYNLLYFLFGDAMYGIALYGITLLGIKYFIFPVIVILRRLLIKGGDE